MVGYQIAYAATFGQTSEVGYTLDCGILVDANGKSATMYTLTENGAISKITAYAAKQLGDRVAKAVIYSENPANTPDVLLATSQEVALTSTSYAWIDFTFSTPVELTAGNYFIGIITDAVTSNTVTVKCGNTGSLINSFNTDTYSDGAANPFGTPSSSANEKVWYATYTAQETPATTASAASLRTASINLRTGSMVLR